MFDTAFDEWEQAEHAADDAWAAVWHKVRDSGAAAGPPASDPEVASALRLRRHARRLLHHVQQELRASREQLPIL